MNQRRENVPAVEHREGGVVVAERKKTTMSLTFSLLLAPSGLGKNKVNQITWI